MALCGPSLAHTATETSLDRKAAFAYSQEAIGRQVGDYRFVDAAGRGVRLSDYAGKPLVVSLIYTSCFHTCPLITRRLDQMVEIAREALGPDGFAVVSVGFDAAVDNPQRMRDYAREHGVTERGWGLLSADPETIEGLTQDLGFLYFPSPRGFDHLAQVSIVDAGGRVYRQIYGETFDAPALVEPLKELALDPASRAQGIEGLIESVRLFCTVYDPASGRYTFDNSIFVVLATGILCLGGIAIFIVRSWRESKPSRPAVP